MPDAEPIPPSRLLVMLAKRIAQERDRALSEAVEADAEAQGIDRDRYTWSNERQVWVPREQASEED